MKRRSRAGSFHATTALEHGRLWLFGASAVAFDLGILAALVAHQTIVYGIEPGARSRVNAVLVVGMFVGMASGAALGSVLLARWG